MVTGTINAGWMYEAYRKQAAENLSDEEALQLVFDRIKSAEIWIPEQEIVSRYRAKKTQFRKRLAGENVPQHICAMENILDKATYMMDTLEKKIAEYEDFQSAIKRLEAYYTILPGTHQQHRGTLQPNFGPRWSKVTVALSCSDSYWLHGEDQKYRCPFYRV